MRGKRQGSISPDVEKQVERIKEKLKIPITVYDITRKQTTEFIRETKPTVEYIKETKKTVEFDVENRPTTQFIRRTEPTTEFIKEEKTTVEFVKETQPTTEFITQKKDTIEFIPKKMDTIQFVPKKEEYSVEEVIQKALDQLMKKNQLVVPKAKFTEQTIIVSKFLVKCPDCGCEHTLGGMKK